jgi:3-oxoacyl-(acyl-carrier-protein) synthase
MQRIFISGIGVASCLGNDRRTFWKNIISSQCGIDTLKVHDTTDMEVNIGGEVQNMDESRINVNDTVSTRKMDRASQFAVLAAHEALEDAGLPTKEVGDNAAVILGAGLAGLETYETQHEKLLTRGPCQSLHHSNADAQRPAGKCESRIRNSWNCIHLQQCLLVLRARHDRCDGIPSPWRSGFRSDWWY